MKENTTTTSEAYREICRVWNEFSPKRAHPDDLITQQQVIRTADDEDVFAACTVKDFIAAMKNYELALSLPQSQAWKYNLYNFAARAYRKFLPGVFDIDNYDRSNFTDKGKTDGRPFAQREDDYRKQKEKERAERILKNVEGD